LPDNLGRPTIRQLLSHTSGLPDHFSLPEIPAIMRNPITPDGIIALMAEAEPRFEPGAQHSYSNFNYVLLGKLIETLDEQHRDYGTYIEEEIFAPLGMMNSHYDRQAAIIPNRARGYDHDGSGPVNTITFETSLAYAAGALMSSANDMALFTRALRGETLLSAEMKEAAWTPVALPNGQATNYGLGFNIGEFLGETAIWHNGSINGFQAAWIYLPASDRTVAVLSNGHYRPNTTVLARRILASLAGRPIPRFSATETEDAALAPFAGRYRLDDGRILQIHVQDGARFNIDGGRWNELTFSGENLFYISDSLTHVRFRTDPSGSIGALTYVSSTLTAHQGRRIEGEIEGAAIAIPLDPEETEALIGNWRMSSGDALAITRDGEELRFRMPNQPPERLYRSAPRHYFARTAPIEMILSENGEELELNLYGNTISLAKE
ncbi:MAG: serine hydrolase domain-containing protein, partial [Parasphingopyxis sp.]